MDGRRRKGADILGPVLLLAAGCILLLNTLGVLEWSVWWVILRLWPIFLIALGLDLLIGRLSIWGSILAAVLVVAVLVLALWFGRSDLATSGLAEQQILVPRSGAAQAEVLVEPVTGVLHIDGLPESANLVEGVVLLGKGEHLVHEVYLQGGGTVVTFKTEGQVWGALNGTWNEDRVWELGLGPAVKLDLRTSMPVGESVIDLTGLMMNELAISGGLGRTEITLPAQGSFWGRIGGAIGETVVIVPEGLPVRLHVDAGLAVQELPEGYTDLGDGILISPSYEGAANPVELVVSQAIGFLRIVSQ